MIRHHTCELSANWIVQPLWAQHTAWCNEIGSLTSLHACTSGASSDHRQPISLHQAVLVGFVCLLVQPSHLACATCAEISFHLLYHLFKIVFFYFIRLSVEIKSLIIISIEYESTTYLHTPALLSQVPPFWQFFEQFALQSKVPAGVLWHGKLQFTPRKPRSVRQRQEPSTWEQLMELVRLHWHVWRQPNPYCQLLHFCSHL